MASELMYNKRGVPPPRILVIRLFVSCLFTEVACTLHAALNKRGIKKQLNRAILGFTTPFFKTLLTVPTIGSILS